MKKRIFVRTSGFRPVRKITFFFLALALLAGCSADKDTFVSRNYHSLVSHFNGYYHAHQRYLEGVKQVEQQPSVPETGFISLISLSDPQAAQASYAQFDEATKKLDVLIFRHKNSRWLDDSYLLKGKIAFQKRNYYEAMLNFEYVLKKFPKTELAAEVLLWMARAELMAENPYRASELIKTIRSRYGTLEKRLRPDIAELEVTLLLQQEKYNEALVILQTEYPYVKGRRRKARWQYLTGQLLDVRNAFPPAVQAFQLTAKLNASNQMNFQAKLQLIRLYLKYQPNAPESTEYLAKLLRQMARDGKYKEYRDQIYYQYAELALKQKDTERALKYLRRSLDESKGNPRQKTLSYYRYGEINFYQLNRLDIAQAYFDSAATVAPQDFPDRQRIVNLSATLKDYVRYRQVIQEQDSLLSLSRMNEGELLRYIDRKLDEEERQKEQKLADLRDKQRELEARRLNELNQNLGRPGDDFSVSSSFKFDDPNLVARGEAAFRRSWGERPDADNWRRSSKRTLANAGQQREELTVEALRPSSTAELEARKDAYLKNVPRTPEQRQAASLAIADATFELANLMHQKLFLYDSAVVYYTQLIKGYPEYENLPRAMYSLYQLLKDLKKPEAADYRARILAQYPSTIYARLIQQEGQQAAEYDPDYDFQQSYQNLYTLYETGDYNTALALCNYLLESSLDHPEAPKVYYLLSQLQARMDDREGMKQSLEYLSKNWPTSEQAQVARQTLAYLSGKTEAPQAAPATAGGNTADAALQGFVDRAGNESTTVVILIDQERVKNSDLDVIMANFQKQYFSYTGQKDEKYHMVYVTKFQDYNLANTYVQALASYEPLMELLKGTQPDDRIFFLSLTNFKTAFSQRRFHDYARYYQAYKQEMIRGRK
jgi:tetratricopeptide (TPR) repeat protein